MKILFAPSEAKHPGGSGAPFSKESFLFPQLFDKRREFLQHYQGYIDSAATEQLQKLFGTKKPEVIERYAHDLFSAPTMKAIERYDGVAFDHLDYGSLDADAQNYVDANLVIFSNLFGPVLAGDRGLPEYKLKQGEKVSKLAPEKFYKEHFSKALDSYLAEEEVLDLRAGFYDKFYKITKPYTTMKFLKNGKSVSHWAKAYRGTVLRRMAQEGIESIRQLEAMEIENLMIEEIKTIKNKTELVYRIVG
jgi:cytoplasmic iron level regulating protein YaaA (DUF328/UPF0246 family)